MFDEVKCALLTACAFDFFDFLYTGELVLASNLEAFQTRPSFLDLTGVKSVRS
jgi:hypothetical protein